MKTHIVFYCFILFLIPCVLFAGGDYVDNGDDTVTDRKTKLMWQKMEVGKMRWETAKNFCNSYDLAGYIDWRLPTKAELTSLVERSMFNPSIDRRFFPKAEPDDYWTSSTGSAAVGSAAWLINFGYGDMRFFNKSNDFYVRCVRKTI